MRDRFEEILKLLLQFEDLFDGILGKFHKNPVRLDFKEGAVSTVAKNHEDTLKKELERLCKIGVLRKCSNSVWATPTLDRKSTRLNSSHP